MPRSTIVMSIIRAANILKSISNGNTRIGKIADSVTLTKGTTHRLLATLAKAGFVVQDPISSKYNLGPALLQLVSDLVSTHASLLNCALWQMKYLRDLTGETVVLHVRSGLERVCIACVESLHTIRYTNAVGFIAPLYLGGAGKILLAELEDRELSLILDNIDLTAVTPHTITDKGKLIEEIRKVREQGYATSYGERTAGSSCVSVAVRNYITPVALSVLGPVTRFKIDERKGLLDQIQASSKKISRKLKDQVKDHKLAES